MKGIVLAGGRSSRFGTNKALAKIQGKTLLEIAVGLLTKLSIQPIVIASSDQDYSYLGCEVREDLIPAKGPLGGLATACHYFPDETLVVLTCDMPAVSPAFLLCLLERHERENGATVFLNQNSLEPFPGVYESSLGNLISKRIQKKQHSVLDFLKSLPRFKRVVLESQRQMFLNVNYKDELEILSDTRHGNGCSVRIE